MNPGAKTARAQSREKTFSIFSYGFRPFFLAAGVYAILPLLPWALYLGGLWDSHISLQNWHAHEMLFGFVAAGISGFLLTAIPNWTGTPPLTGAGLKRMFSFWVVGRIVFWLYLFVDHPVIGWLLLADLLLPVAQSIRTSRIFIKTGNYRNLIFSFLLICLAAANLLVILDLNGWAENTTEIAILLAPNIIMVYLAIVGGRVIPNFTRTYLQKQNRQADIITFQPVEKLAIGLLLINVISDLLIPHTLPAYLLAIGAGGIHLLRFVGWKTFKILDNPLLWVLHLGYVWLILSLVFKGLEGFAELPYHLYLHILTLGAVGTFLIGVMSRAALGHTGRDLRIGPIMALAYLLISLSTIIRALAVFTVNYNLVLMEVTTLVWVLAFGIFLWTFTPILTQPRIDGRPG